MLKGQCSAAVVFHLGVLVLVSVLVACPSSQPTRRHPDCVAAVRTCVRTYSYTYGCCMSRLTVDASIRQKAHSSDVSRAQLKYRTVELSKEQAKVLYAKGQPCYRARLVRQPTSLEPGHAEVSASSTLLSCFPSPLTAPPSSPPYCRHDAVKKDDPTSGSLPACHPPRSHIPPSGWPADPKW